MKTFARILSVMVVIASGSALAQRRGPRRAPRAAAPSAPASDTAGRTFCCTAIERSGQQYQIDYAPDEYSTAAIASVHEGNRNSCESLGGVYRAGTCSPEHGVVGRCVTDSNGLRTTTHYYGRGQTAYTSERAQHVCGTGAFSTP